MSATNTCWFCKTELANKNKADRHCAVDKQNAWENVPCRDCGVIFTNELLAGQAMKICRDCQQDQAFGRGKTNFQASHKHYFKSHRRKIAA